MNKQKAIEWCNENLSFWAKTTMQPAPDGWKWLKFMSPYKRNVLFLQYISEDETIDREDTEVKY